MGGKHKAEKKDKKKDKAGAKKSGVIATMSAAAAVPAGPAAYADGAPLDSIQYLEAKLILTPDRFTSVKSFRDFGDVVQRTAEAASVGFIEDEMASRRPQIREIVFFDTPDFALYRNAFILRRRIPYVDGFPVGDPEIVFKFRHPDEQRAAEVDVRPKIEGKHRIKFKAEALPLKDQLGGYRILYSHNAVFGASQIGKGDAFAVGKLKEMFRPLANLKGSRGDEVRLVNNGIVEEVLLPLGQLDFGKGLVGKCDIGLWRTRGEHRPLVGEFAFQLKFAKKEAVADQQKARAAGFYVTLQQAVKEWIALGVTKTAMVYRLNGSEPQSHE